MRIPSLIQLFAYNLDDKLTPSRTIIKIHKNDLLPGTQGHATVNKGHRERAF